MKISKGVWFTYVMKKPTIRIGPMLIFNKTKVKMKLTDFISFDEIGSFIMEDVWRNSRARTLKPCRAFISGTEVYRASQPNNLRSSIFFCFFPTDSWVSVGRLAKVLKQ